MMLKRTVLRDALDIASMRPPADMAIEQYLMTPESLTEQVRRVESIFRNKTILHLGDDDHLSVLFAKYLGVCPVVAEYDERIRTSLRAQYDKYSIDKYSIFKYDARSSMPKHVKADAFYINPPYSSKNKGKGAKVWISRVAPHVPVGSTSILVYPIDESLPWTLSCLREIIHFAYKCGLMIVDIERDVHTYEYLPKDPGLLSSNIYFFKFSDQTTAEVEDIAGESLYR